LKNLFQGMRGNPASAGATAAATAAAAPGAANVAPTQQPFRRQSFGFGPPRGSPEQFEMVQSLVTAAMRSAQGSGSPIVSFLAPLLGSAALGRAASLQGEASQAGISEMGRTLYGRDMSQREMDLFGIANNENAPATFRDRARRELERLLAGAAGGGGGGRTPSPNPTGGRSGGGTAAPTAADDGVASLTDALAAGATPAPSVLAELEATMNNPRATAQSRAFAERQLREISEGARSGDRPGYSSSTPSTPMLGVTPPSYAAPVTPMALPEEDRNPNRPPPPPGTVPY
jgi:hypothetical protein